MTNPFDLRGPEFLVFYGVLGVATVAIYWFWVRYIEAQNNSADIRDPYQIAYLRGGAREVLRVVLISLIERGLLLQDDGDTVKTRHSRSVESVRRPIERFILDIGKTPIAISQFFSGAVYDQFAHLCAECREPLGSARHILCFPVFLRRLMPFLVALAILAGTALQKMLVALSRGRYNIEFLIVMALAFCVCLCVILLRARTASGAAQLRSLKKGFAHLKGEARQGRMDDTFKTTMLTAVFGLSALSAVDYPYVGKLFPRATRGSGTGSEAWSFGGCSGSGCAGGVSAGGSGCSGGGGGGGDGGGGGGGGCGGCGG